MEDIDPLFLFLSLPLPKRRAHTRTHARKRTRSIPTSRLTDWIRKKRKKKKTLPGIVQAARVRSNRRLVFFFFYFLFHFWERSRKKQLTRNNQTISSPLQPKNDSNGWCIAAICFCFVFHFPWWNINAKRNLLRRPKKKQKHSTKQFTTKENRVSAYPLWNSSKLFLVVLLLLFFHTSKENENLFLSMDFSSQPIETKSRAKSSKRNVFPFTIQSPSPPHFPLGSAHWMAVFFLKIRQTQAPDVVDDENELVPDQITNEAATQPYLEEPQTLTNNARCRDFFVYLFLLRVKREPECNQRQCEKELEWK